MLDPNGEASEFHTRGVLLLQIAKNDREKDTSSTWREQDSDIFADPNVGVNKLR